jgi:hypothetical protein
VIDRLAHEADCDHWMADRLPESRRRRLAKLHAEGLTVESAAALRWLLRNEIYFDLGLSALRERVMTVRYEALAEQPQKGFGALFDFLALPLDPAWIADVKAGSVGRGRQVQVAPAVAALCDDLAQRLDAATGGAS